MRIIVQKFGGTSVATPEARRAAARHVAAAVDAGYRPVVVVSAMGRAGDPYATDTLLELARREYRNTAPRELDLLASCGEIIAAVLMANTIRSLGHPAVALTGGQAGIITDRRFTDARILRVEPEGVIRRLGEGDVVVVAGFQGVTEDGDVTTLGRGGSDTTAAALAVALRAEAVDIYTDVDGVYTADPRMVPDARPLEAVSYEEVAQMAVQGARVVHPRAVEIAMRGNVPVRVRSTFADGPGTLITHSWQVQSASAAIGEARVITGVVHMPGMTLLRVWPPADGAGGDRSMFRALADAGISLDMINVSPDRKAFIVKDEHREAACRILEGLGARCESVPGCAKVTVVGMGMRGVPGVMAAIVEALEGAGVNILLSVDSHMTISCLVPGDQMEVAVRALHERFDLAHAERPAGDPTAEATRTAGRR